MTDTPKKKPRRPVRWGIRGLLLLVLAYALAAILPYAFPPQLSEDALADRSWLETDASDAFADRATTLPTGQEALATRLALIASAQESIRAGSYIYAADGSGEKISAALLDAADRGVQVQLIIDGLIGQINLGSSPLGPALGSHPNIEIRFYNPVDLLAPVGLNARYHEKYFVVDDTWMALGGRNVSDEFLTGEGDPHYNYDMDVLVHREDASARDAVAQLAEYFDALWDSALCATRFDSVPASDAARVEQCRASLRETWAALRAEYPLMLPDPAADLVPVEKTILLHGSVDAAPKEPVVFARLCQLMADATERVWLETPYLVLDGPMRETMQAALTAAPSDRILINSRNTGNNIIASADYTLSGGAGRSLGAELWEFQGDWSMHTKALLVDSDVSVFGSFNFDPRSAYIDTEVMLVVYSEPLNARLAADMQALWDQSLQVDADGAYVVSDVAPKEATLWKRLSIALLSPLVYLVRFLT